MSRTAPPRGHILWGHAREIARAPHSFPAEIAWRGGGIGSFRILHRQIVAISDADLARQVLVTHEDRYQRSWRHRRSARAILGDGLLSTEGEPWLAHRRQMLPAFRHERPQRIAMIAGQETTRLLQEWEAQRRAGEPVALGAAMQRLTIAVMGQALLSSALGAGDAAHFGEAVRDSLALLRARNNARLRLPLWLPSAANQRLHRTRAALDAFVLGHIAARRSEGARRDGDMLDGLMAARDAAGGTALSAAALRDETKTLFVAGFETTATALTWTLYLLARHAGAAAALRAELDQALGGNPPQWADLERLPALRAFVEESLRLYPPVYSLPRDCIAEDALGGRTIRPGTLLLVSIFGIHRSPDWWPDPERFDPARFAAGARWPQHALLPFGTGRHACIGAELAMTEMMMVLALVAQRYDLTLADDGPVEMAARITLAPAREIPLRLAPRPGL